MITIIDYEAGNLKNVEKACAFLKQEVQVSDKPEALLKSDGLILPGVGAFGDAMKRLWEKNLVSVIREAVQREIPLLGICLGEQLIFESSEESPGVEGLGLLKGKVVRFPADMGLKVPHMGWNTLQKTGKHPLLEGVSDTAHVYFVHSYVVKAEDRGDVLATAAYGVPFDAVVGKGNLFATQFHPEKSGAVGLRILKNFYGIVEDKRRNGR